MSARAASVTLVALVASASALAGCRATRDPPPDAAAPAPEPTSSAAPPVSAAGESVAEDGRIYPLRAFAFDLTTHDVRLVDVGMRRELAPLLASPDDVLAVNAGFYDEADRPIGLARSEGRELAPLRRALSGGVLVVRGGQGHLFEAESFDAEAGAGASAPFALQCRPRLVVSGSVNVRKDDGKRAERTALCLKDAGRALEVVVVREDERGAAGGPSLHALAEALARRGCHDALNLDGGPSTGFARRDGARVEDASPRRGVRHAIVVRRVGPAPR